MGYQQKAYKKWGGEEIVVASGGKVKVESGGELDVESGGEFKIAGTEMTRSAADLNVMELRKVSTVINAGTNVQTVVAMPTHAQIRGMVVVVGASAWGDNSTLKIGFQADDDAFLTETAGEYVQTADAVIADRCTEVAKNLARMDGDRMQVTGSSTVEPLAHIFMAATNIIATPSATPAATKTATVHVLYNEL